MKMPAVNTKSVNIGELIFFTRKPIGHLFKGSILRIHNTSSKGKIDPNFVFLSVTVFFYSLRWKLENMKQEYIDQTSWFIFWIFNWYFWKRVYKKL